MRPWKKIFRPNALRLLTARLFNGFHAECSSPGEFVRPLGVVVEENRGTTNARLFLSAGDARLTGGANRSEASRRDSDAASEDFGGLRMLKDDGVIGAAVSIPDAILGPTCHRDPLPVWHWCGSHLTAIIGSRRCSSQINESYPVPH